MSGVNFTKDSAARIGRSVRDFEQRPENLPGRGHLRGFRRPIIAKIDGSTDDEYEATEQIWDDATTAFITLPNGRIWDGVSNLPVIYETNGLTGVADDSIIQPFWLGDNAGNIIWFFNFSGSGGVFICEITGASTGNEQGPYPGRAYLSDLVGGFTVVEIKVPQVSTGTGHEFPIGTRALGTLKEGYYWMQPAVFV